MPERAIACPSCGTTGVGNFCAQCGTPRSGAACVACTAPLAAGSQFCSRCGAPAGAPLSAGKRDRTPWMIAGLALAGLLAVLLLMLSRQSPGGVTPPETEP